MRRAIAAIPALVVTLGLFFLMQLLISGDGRDLSKPVTSGGVGLVTLIRNTVSSAGNGTQPSPIPPTPAPTVVPPAPPPPTMAEINPPAEPDLTTDIAVPEVPAIEALPYLGGPPVMPVKPKIAKNKAKERKAAKKKSRKGSRNAKAKAKSADGDKSAPASRGKTAAGVGRGSGGKRGKGRSGGGAKSKSSGNSGVVVLSRPKPAYPRKALRSKKEGWVKVSFTVTEKGAVANPKVVAAKPRRVFERSALQAIRKWRFKPKKVGGKPVRARATQVIQFSLAKR